MAAVKEVELIVPQGTTYTYVVTFVDPDNAGAPVDLSGYSARMQARAKVADTATLYSTTSSGGHLTLGATAGTVTLVIPASVTAAWTFKRAVFDLEVESPSGAVYRLVKGVLSVDPEVTR